MQLTAYIDLIYDLIRSRRDLQVEQLVIEQFEGGSSALIEGRLRFWNNSLLRFSEELIERGLLIAKQGYVYHYQTAEKRLIFRYDNSPHFPDIATFPHHKHFFLRGEEQVAAATPPSLFDVLHEIERNLYPD